MKKCLIILFVFIFTTDSYSSGIASSANTAPCTNTTLETYSGNSNLSADWQPNEIKLRWYNGNTLMDVQTAANTCVYDDTLTIPSTTPNRTGYTFAGWTVRPEIDFATTIPLGVDGTNRWSIGWYNNENYCLYDTDTGDSKHVSCTKYSEYDDLQTYEWKVRFSHGDLYGMVGCSATGGTPAQPGTPPIGSGKHCWCKATGYKPSGTDVIKRPASTLSWVYGDSRVDAVDCARACIAGCTKYAEKYQEFRAALFTPAAQ